MKFELKEYQLVAAAKVLTNLRKGSAEFEQDGEYTAVSLAAPTASGKTVIAASVIEQILFGDSDGIVSPDPNATFLWLTDDPSLNAQTRKNLLSASDRLQPSQLVVISDDFDQPEFDRGIVYFLNIQKLAKSSNLVRRKENRRDHPIWETITRSIERNGAHYYLVIDEAHRGTRSRSRDRQTLAQRLTSGEEGYVPPSPVVWGISATPKLFNEAMERANPTRVNRKIEVPVEEVRESGLIKDILSIHHQREKQTMETTLLRAAVRNLKELDATWKAYTEAEGEPPVKPALVIQLPPNRSAQDVGELLDVCFEEWDELNADLVAHSLEDHTAQEFGEHVVRYVAPQDIQDHPSIRVVLFKEALTTGWDCPRAEVMVSLRRAKDDTYIAQLIGRMVRTPLARRVESDESLNRVFLYLPNFDLDAVLKVKEHLEADAEALSTEVVINSVNAPRNRQLPEEVFEKFERLPSYVVPGPVHRSQIGRLHKLAGLLAGDGLATNAVENADKFLVGVLEGERERLESEGALRGLIEDAEKASISIVDVSILSDEEDARSAIELATDIGDVDRLFKQATRRLADGVAKTYWSHRVTAEGDDSYDAKILAVALSADPAVAERLDREAGQRVRQWLKTYGDQIATLSADKKARYGQVRAMTRDPETIRPTLPTVATMSDAEDIPAYGDHLFADGNGKFKTKLRKWERHVLEVERSRQGFLAWYRNPTGGERALRIPYQEGNSYGKLYPDFVFFHRDEESDGVVASLVDPHGAYLSDAGPKLRGMAAYAEKHGEEYGQVMSVTQVDGEFLFLDMLDPTIRGALADVGTKAEIEAVFAEHGAIYE
jgi:type III restriction enzyme